MTTRHRPVARSKRTVRSRRPRRSPQSHRRQFSSVTGRSGSGRAPVAAIATPPVTQPHRYHRDRSRGVGAGPEQRFGQCRRVWDVTRHRPRRGELRWASMPRWPDRLPPRDLPEVRGGNGAPVVGQAVVTGGPGGGSGSMDRAGEDPAVTGSRRRWPGCGLGPVPGQAAVVATSVPAAAGRVTVLVAAGGPAQVGLLAPAAWADPAAEVARVASAPACFHGATVRPARAEGAVNRGGGCAPPPPGRRRSPAGRRSSPVPRRRRTAAPTPRRRRRRRRRPRPGHLAAARGSWPGRPGRQCECGHVFTDAPLRDAHDSVGASLRLAQRGQRRCWATALVEEVDAHRRDHVRLADQETDPQTGQTRLGQGAQLRR